MLDVELDLVSQLSVVTIALLEIEINKEAQVIIEGQQFLLASSIGSQLTFKLINITAPLNAPGAAVIAMAVLWHEWLDVHFMLVAHDCFLIVLAAAVCALVLSLFNGNLDFLWEVQVDESIHTSSVLFEHFCFWDISGEVGKDESIPAGVGDSQHLECQSILDLLLEISGVKHFLGLQEEWVAHFLLFTSECLYVFEDL